MKLATNTRSDSMPTAPSKDDKTAYKMPGCLDWDTKGDATSEEKASTLPLIRNVPIAGMVSARKFFPRSLSNALLNSPTGPSENISCHQKKKVITPIRKHIVA
ncbi:hypothetical protein HMPREF9005_2274 [Actinomyces sp. oral taxon 178 str. F0338]|nr:hypothetical protein HMPREF9005_2274 [Actinomyces sp. oral taxon 178 str. F0338]